MPRDTVAEIKNRLTIAEVIAPYVKLAKAGRSLRGLCPFHKEKTPSFHVSLDRGTFHCFGCGVGGDAFSFIEKIEGVDFKGALTLLAEKAGVEIEYDPSARAKSSRAERLREVLARAVDFYTSRLTEDSEAYAYATKRGLSPETISSWQLGVAPDDWRIALEHLTGKGFNVEELSAAGLIKEADGKRGTYYDRFRNRLMFPIRDVAGRSVAFTGRALSKSEEAKYLNSPDTDLYHKSEILFGLDRAKDAIRTRGFSILVEGQMDLLHAHQAGFTNAVALSGTAFTERHATLLARSAPNLMLILDADPAGLAATAKAAILALGAGMRVKAVLLPAGKDPAELIAEDQKEFTKRVTEAKSVVEFFLAVLGERERDPHKLVLAAERIVLPIIRAVKSPMEREHFVEVTARAISLSSEAVREAMGRIQKESSSETKRSETKEKRSLRETRDDILRAAVLAYPDTPLEKRIKTEYARIVGAPLKDESLPESALFSAEELFGENPSEDAADDLLNAFEEASIREAYREAVLVLRRAEASGDTETIKAAEAACTRLGAMLSKLTPLSK